MRFRKKTIAILLFAILALSFTGIFVSAEFPWSNSLTVKNSATSTWTTSMAYTGFYSVHLETTGTVGSGDEARFVVTVPSGITLGDIYTISWQEFLVKGYPPHVDIIVDLGGGVTDALVFEYAYNGHIAEAPMPYGALTGFWYQTFSDDGNGPATITGTTYCWLSSGPPGGPGIIGGLLNTWKAGTVTGGLGINANTPVLRLEFEIDNWVVQTEAYLDDVEINGLDIMGVSGPVGPQGPMGPAGATGATGADGPTGPAGADGVDGAQGPQGDQGVPGIKGDTGDTGDTGATGPQGEQGDTGEQGIQGETGADGVDGIDGEDGATGATGPQGYRGVRGYAGSTGSTGPQGENGTTGLPGLDGYDGETGPIGPQGTTGAKGATGTQGETGSLGEAGEQGPKGDTGKQGLAGSQGEQGPAGATGETGPPVPVVTVGGVVTLSSVIASVLAYFFVQRRLT